MPDEIWTTRDGSQVEVRMMTAEHARNALRMILRQARLRKERRKRAVAEVLDDFVPERPDNHTTLADLRQRHGNVRVEHKSVAGMGGADVYVGDRWVCWLGGI